MANTRNFTSQNCKLSVAILILIQVLKNIKNLKTVQKKFFEENFIIYLIIQ